MTIIQGWWFGTTFSCLLMHVLHAVFCKIGVSPTPLVAECPESECFSGKIPVDDSLECGGFVWMVMVINECCCTGPIMSIYAVDIEFGVHVWKGVFKLHWYTFDVQSDRGLCQ